MRTELILVLLLSVFADRFLGEPPDRFHPTVFMGRAIDYLDKKLSSGLLIHLAVALFFSSIVFTLLYFSAGPIKIVLAAAILKTSYSWRGLKDYTLPIAKNLEQNELVNARRKIPYIAGRNPEALDRRGVISTVVESIAEGSVDSVISPLLFFAFFSVNGLETGVAASVFYRVTNTLDSMLGVPGNQKGLFSAKTDELFNFIPARMGAFLLLLGGVLSGKNFRRGWAVFKRDRNSTASKNAGQTISVMAGLLGVRLKKESSYSLGDQNNELETRHIYEALGILDLSVISLLTVMVIAWI